MTQAAQKWSIEVEGGLPSICLATDKAWITWMPSVSSFGPQDPPIKDVTMAQAVKFAAVDDLLAALRLALPYVEAAADDAGDTLGAFAQEGGGKPSDAMVERLRTSVRAYSAVTAAIAKATGAPQ